MTIDDYFDKIFVINLDSRHDKWQAATLQLDKIHINNFERFSAIKPEISEVPVEYHEFLKASNHSDGTDETYIIGVYGCKLSHLAVIKIARNRGYKKVLIFEDDIEFRNDAHNVFNNAIVQLENNPWHMLYFTGNHGNNYEKFSANLIKIKGSHSTVGYAIAESIYDKVLDYAPKCYQHIDKFYKEMIHPYFECYCIQPHLVWNANGFSDIEQGFREYRVLKRKYT